MDQSEFAFTGVAPQVRDGLVIRALRHTLARGISLAWRWNGDRRAIAALIGRYSAHLGLLILALLIGLVGRTAFTQVTAANVSLPQPQVAAELAVTPTPVVAPAPYWQAEAVSNTVFRQAIPHTTIPERARLEVIQYTVQPGDSVFSIAEQYGLSPYTIAWSNRETLQDAPWLVQPGLPLAILPTDGVYYTVKADDTPEEIAAAFNVDVGALYNEWNNVTEGQPLVEGQQLVIPGGEGPDVEWTAPPPKPVARGVASADYSSGFCSNTAVSGPGANGWFVLPTGSYSVSGWYFHDPRNPGHIGLDYTCHLGDPIYAADNGVVIHSGWGGGYGNLVQVNHGNGYVTYYAHLDSIWVGCGDSVYQGQVVGVCGTTGYSTGPHLHFEIRYGGVPQDPTLYQP